MLHDTSSQTLASALKRHANSKQFCSLLDRQDEEQCISDRRAFRFRWTARRIEKRRVTSVAAQKVSDLSMRPGPVKGLDLQIRDSFCAPVDHTIQPLTVEAASELERTMPNAKPTLKNEPTSRIADLCRSQSAPRIVPELSAALLLLCLSVLTACEPAGDAIRGLGERNRRPATQALNQEELARWERDLNLSRARSEELHKNIQDMVQESNLQGALARKIARAYLDAARYDMAAAYYQAAVRGETQPAAAGDARLLEQAIPFFEEAMRRGYPDPEVFFEAGLCYANASRAFGWDPRRLAVAVYLFERMAAMKPDDYRPRYQLALIYAKVADTRYRNVALAEKILREIVAREEDNMPVRFALAHILAEDGRWQESANEYSAIIERLQALHRRGAIPGKPEDNVNLSQARRNLESLNDCLQNESSCPMISGVEGDEPSR